MSSNFNSGEEEIPSMIQCRVCASTIDINNKKDQFVVKCEYCNEASPIKDPPAGQKYIRCPCNCLLICKSTAQRISCPRQSCKKIIVLCTPTSQENSNNNDISPVPGMCRVNCGHCRETFLFNSLVNQLARCPHCEKKSSVSDFAKSRGILFLIVSLISLVIGIVVTVVTKDPEPGWIILDVIIYIVSVCFIYKSIYYLTMKKSLIVTNHP